MDTIADIITAFLEKIKLPLHFEDIDMPTFLPGILIRNGELVVDRNKLQYPGDVLHEAGHLAVMPPRIRKTMNGDIGSDDIHRAGELGAIAWSYAVCVHLGLDPRVVFHEHGYKGGGAHWAELYSKGSDMGVPLLEWQEMTDKKGAPGSEHYYPAMRSWLCMVDNFE